MRTPKPCILPSEPASLQMLIASGLTDEMVRTQLRAGRLMRLRRNVYVAASAWPEDPGGQHLMTAHAEQVVLPGAALSHHTAALVWKLPTPGFAAWYDQPPAVTLSPGHSRRSGGREVVRHVRRLDSTDVTHDSAGYAVTSLARTAVDVSRSRLLPQQLVVLDAAARLLVGQMVATPRRRDYAEPRLTQAARDLFLAAAGSDLASAIACADARRESPAESLTAGWLALSDCPAPVPQARLDTPWGPLYPDFYWPELKLIGEVDGAVKYDDRTAIVAEKEREQRLRDLGYIIVRWSAREIMLEPQVVIDRIRRAILAAA